MGWRSMQVEDMATVSAISDAVHGRYTEPEAVYAERRALYPSGCFLLEREREAAGYLIAHPWRRSAPPPLGAMVGTIPEDADSFYLHDLALLPSARGRGAGGRATDLALRCAAEAGFRDVYLLAVNGADSFWTLQGFSAVPDDALAAKLRAAYGPEVQYMHRALL